MPSLTELAVKNAKPGQTLWDSSLKGFGLRVGKQRKTFIVLVSSGRRQSVGHWPLISLAEARAEAKRLLAEKALGKVRPNRKAWDDAVKDFLDDCQLRCRPRTHTDYQRLLKSHFPFGRTNVVDISPRQITRQLNTLNDRPGEKEHAFRAARTAFRWMVRQHIIDLNPMERMQTPPLGKPRERILSDDELAQVYKAALAGTDSFSRLVAFLILTGQRRGEASMLQWEMIDTEKQLVTFPANITKNKRTHIIPYGPLLYRHLIHDEAHGEERIRRGLVFASSRTRTDGHKGTPEQIRGPIRGWSKLKPKFDKSHGVADYTLHDLRRTFSSGLARLQVPIAVTEKLLNHVSGVHSGVRGIYDRFDYLEPMRAALLKWERFLNNLAGSGD